MTINQKKTTVEGEMRERGFHASCVVTIDTNQYLNKESTERTKAIQENNPVYELIKKIISERKTNSPEAKQPPQPPQQTNTVMEILVVHGGRSSSHSDIHMDMYANNKWYKVPMVGNNKKMKDQVKVFGENEVEAILELQLEQQHLHVKKQHKLKMQKKAAAQLANGETPIDIDTNEPLLTEEEEEVMKKKVDEYVPRARFGHQMVSRQGYASVVLIGGGTSNDKFGVLLNDVWEFSLYRGWSCLKDHCENEEKMPSMRFHTALYHQPSDDIVIYHGCHVYHVNVGRMNVDVQPGPCDEIRTAHSTNWITRDQMIIFGGVLKNAQQNDLWIYNATTHEWKALEQGGEQPCARSHHGSFVHHEKLYIYAGETRKVADLDSLYVYSLNTHQWKRLTIPVVNAIRKGFSISLFETTNPPQFIRYGGVTGNRRDYQFHNNFDIFELPGQPHMKQFVKPSIHLPMAIQQQQQQPPMPFMNTTTNSRFVYNPMPMHPTTSPQSASTTPTAAAAAVAPPTTSNMGTFQPWGNNQPVNMIPAATTSPIRRQRSDHTSFLQSTFFQPSTTEFDVTSDDDEPPSMFELSRENRSLRATVKALEQKNFAQQSEHIREVQHRELDYQFKVRAASQHRFTLTEKEADALSLDKLHAIKKQLSASLDLIRAIENKGTLCIQCKRRNRSVVFSCGHCKVCDPCAEELVKCPICSAFIDYKLPVIL